MSSEEPNFGIHDAAKTAPISTLATAMLFGSITFATATLAAKSYLSGDLRPIRAAMNPRASPLDVRSLTSLYTLLHHFTVFGLILFFAYICEYHPPFPHAEKSYDRDEFFFLTALLFVVSAYTVHKNDPSDSNNSKKKLSKEHESEKELEVTAGGEDTATSTNSGRSKDRPVADVVPANDVLNRDQTEEWKGWMQFMFLLYHYYHAEETYNSIRIMITCYVWMTGFGNFSFFYLKGDYSSVRVLQMLWRLNFLVVFLCLSQGTTYILYYICPLHTFFFLMVYVAMRIGKNLNYTKYGIRIKMACLAVLIFLMWDVDTGLFRLVHSPILREVPKLGATSGSMWEWYFRSTLDHWSTFLGMVFALNFPITSLFYRKLEAKPCKQEWLGKGAVGIAIFGAFYLWVSGPFMQPKLEYNATNAYFGFVPLLTYIYFRNLTPTLRSYSLDLLHQIGKTTLETYLMQHHIWLTSDAKSLLTLIPGWPKINMLLVTFIYFYISRRLYKLTLFLRGMLLPDDRNKCIRSLVFMSAIIGVFYAIAIMLEHVDMMSLTAVGFVSVVGGMIGCRTISAATWKETYGSDCTSGVGGNGRKNNGGHGTTSSSHHLHGDGTHPNESKTSGDNKSYTLMFGAIAVLLIGFVWHGMANIGAAKIQPLPEGCTTFLNEGKWIPVDACNEGSRGDGYRSQGVMNYATCSTSSSSGGTYVWGWNALPSSTHCRFVRRDSKAVKKTLNHRQLLFVGDSVTRNLYFAILRAMGMEGAGSYNGTMTKHANITNTIGRTTIDFRWAPYAIDQLANLKQVYSSAENSNGNNQEQGLRPDLIVVGGGTWDRLHNYTTVKEQSAHRQAVTELASVMKDAKKVGIPVAWLVPTTINTDALLTDEKRDHMREEDMKEIRELYEKLGVHESSSVVIDGPAFTAARVKESHDGVHYPAQVYDAGAQILVNAMDWILPKREVKDPFNPPQPGRMANPMLGLFMLVMVTIGLAFFDGFMGFSYLASLFVPDVRPNSLYEEAFGILHRKMKLPPIEGSSSRSKSNGGGRGGEETAGASRNGGRNSIHQTTGDEEIAALLGGNSADMEMVMRK